MNDIKIRDIVRKNSKKPFQKGNKTAKIITFDKMLIKNNIFDVAILEGCKGMVEVRRLIKV